MKKLLLIFMLLPEVGIAQCPQWISVPVDSAKSLLSITEKLLKIRFKEWQYDGNGARTAFSYTAAASEPTADASWMKSRFHIFLANDKTNSSHATTASSPQVSSIRIAGVRTQMSTLLNYLKTRAKSCENYLEDPQKRTIRFGKSLINYLAAENDPSMMEIIILADPDSSLSTSHEQLAIHQKLNKPEGIALDASGNIYFPDTQNDRICKVEKSSGKLITIAGTATGGFSGDGGPAINAQLKEPTGLVLTPSGDIYFGDRGNFRIRKIDGKTGVISTLTELRNMYLTGVKNWQLQLINDEEIYFIANLPFLQKVNLQTGAVTTLGNVVQPECFTILPNTKKIVVAIASQILEVHPAELKVTQNDAQLKMVEVKTASLIRGDAGGADDPGSFTKLTSMSSDNQGNIYFTKDGDSSASIFFLNMANPVIKKKANLRNGFVPLYLHPVAFVVDQHLNFYLMEKDASMIMKINYEKDEAEIIAGTRSHGKGFDPAQQFQWLRPNKK